MHHQAAPADALEVDAQQPLLLLILAAVHWVLGPQRGQAAQLAGLARRARRRARAEGPRRRRVHLRLLLLALLLGAAAAAAALLAVAVSQIHHSIAAAALVLALRHVAPAAPAAGAGAAAGHAHGAAAARRPAACCACCWAAAAAQRREEGGEAGVLVQGAGVQQAQVPDLCWRRWRGSGVGGGCAARRGASGTRGAKVPASRPAGAAGARRLRRRTAARGERLQGEQPLPANLHPRVASSAASSASSGSGSSPRPAPEAQRWCRRRRCPATSL